jgi:hypothetical protein
MTDTFRALCSALLDEIAHESPTTCLARAALAAEPVGEGPSDEELLELRRCAGPAEGWETTYRDFIKIARAVLARWGHPATLPAPEPGEGQS